MPEVKTWIMIGAIVFAWAMYTYPAKMQSIGDTTFGRVNEFIKVKGVEKVQEKAEDVCPDTLNYVCGSDGVTYDNFCKAVVAGIYEVEEGEC